MLEVIHRMADEISGITPREEIKTIYIGGGTPSLLGEGMIPYLLARIYDRFSIASDAEITIEVNPSSLTAAKAAEYIRCGINRASVGVQSLHAECLKTLGRIHDPEKALQCIDILQDAGFENISADLIIGVPGQGLEDVICDLNLLASKGIKHLSTYSLSIEQGTPFYKRYHDTIEDLVPPEKERQMYHLLRAELIRLGYHPYEISNACIPGYESRHNSSYWEGEEYYGIGPGAHGYIDGVRYMHPDSIREYIQDPFSTVTEEVLDDDAKMREYPFLKLRTSEGIRIASFEERFGRGFMSLYADAVKKNVDEGLLEVCDGHVRLTENGIDWCNKVTEDFL